MQVANKHISRRRRALRWLGVSAGLVTAGVVMAPPTAAAPNATRNTWAEAAPTPEPRFGAAAATGLDGTVYAISGLCPNLFGLCRPVGTNEAYSPAHNTWTERAPIPTPRQCLAAATGTDGRIYVLGGEDTSGTSLTTAEAYDPGTNAWVELPPLQQDRGCLAAAADSQGRIYAIGGAENNSTVGFTSRATVERYDPIANSWSFVAPLPVGVDTMGAATGPDGRIYVIGGETFTPCPGSCSSFPSNVVYAYDPSTDSWANLAVLTPSDRYVGVQVVAGPDGRIYAIGGDDFSFDLNELNLVTAYTPATNSWASVPSTIDPCFACAASASSGKVYTVGGSNSSFQEQNTVDAYTPAKVSTTSLTSSQNPSASGAIVTLTATVFPNSVTGTVTFMDGGTALGAVTIGKGGIASLATSSLSVGSHSLTAVYGSNTVYGGSTSLPVNQVVQ